ncbi:MAG: hypothetical protein IKV25_02345 [Clostridia bacterium]|nr:hypothetical protein [Clostridia bacterium]
MAEIDLKAYTTRAKELESAIFTQKRLMDSHKSLFDSERPVEPQKQQIPEPTKPFHPGEPDFSVDHFLIIVFGIALVIGVIMCAVNEGLGVLLGPLLVAGGGIMFISGIIVRFQHQSEHEKALENYERQMKEYNSKMSTYKIQLSNINSTYPIELEDYREKVTVHDSKVSGIMSQHKKALASLEESINAVYDENIIFPKYRNLVAITAINEYLLSGRCDKLEGPDGAYNLYEMELRQNIIIAQLSSIIDNLEQIRNNQYSLYEELQKSNCIIDEILSETHKMNESAKLTAYFAGITALAETSPKYYHGIVM